MEINKMFEQMTLSSAKTECNVPSSSEKRATSWLSDRIKKGSKDRFSECILITPHLARDMLKCQKNNRPMSPPTVARYARIMQEGGWKLTSEGLAFDKTGTLQNGQHRLNAVIESACTVNMLVWFGTEPAEFNYLDQNRDRSAGDLIAMHGLDHWNERATVARLTILVETMSDDEAKIRMANAIFVKEKTISMATPLMLTALRAAQASKKVMPVATGAFTFFCIGSHSKRPDLLPSFWARLATGVGISTSDPVGKIRDPIMLGEIGNKNGRSTAIKRAAAVIHAWNASISGRRKFNFQWAPASSLPEVL